MERQEVFDRLVDTYFKKSYRFHEDPWNEEDEAFLRDNVFKAIVTDESKNNGYQGILEDPYAEGIELNKPYTVNYMDVGRSSSDVILEEFPNKFFNTVNFEYYIENEG